MPDRGEGGSRGRVHPRRFPKWCGGGFIGWEGAAEAKRRQDKEDRFNSSYQDRILLILSAYNVFSGLNNDTAMCRKRFY